MYTDPLMQRNIIVPHFADGRVRYRALDPYRKMLYLNSLNTPRWVWASLVFHMAMPFPSRLHVLYRN